MRLKHWLAAAVAALLLHTAVTNAQAGPSGTDWLWIAPLIAAGAVGIGYVIIRSTADADDSKSPRPAGARPPRGMLLTASGGSGTNVQADHRRRLVFDFRRCSRGGELALACW